MTEDFEFLNEAKRRFHGERFESLYQAWDSGALSEQALRREFCPIQPDRAVFFENYLVAAHRSHLAEKERGGVNVA